MDMVYGSVTPSFSFASVRTRMAESHVPRLMPHPRQARYPIFRYTSEPTSICDS